MIPVVRGIESIKIESQDGGYFSMWDVLCSVTRGIDISVMTEINDNKPQQRQMGNISGTGNLRPKPLSNHENTHSPQQQSLESGCTKKSSERRVDNGEKRAAILVNTWPTIPDDSCHNAQLT